MADVSWDFMNWEIGLTIEIENQLMRILFTTGDCRLRGFVIDGPISFAATTPSPAFYCRDVMWDKQSASLNLTTNRGRELDDDAYADILEQNGVDARQVIPLRGRRSCFTKRGNRLRIWPAIANFLSRRMSTYDRRPIQTVRPLPGTGLVTVKISGIATRTASAKPTYGSR